jgi:BlaI family transcriptional regulator, penicillinase repressor
MKELTKAEEQVMQYLWKIEKGFVKDIVEQFPEPRPAYTTITTVIRVLVNKGFIGFHTYGKVNEYYPLVSKLEYSKLYFNRVVRNYFSDSYQKFASFFAKENDLSLSELEEIKEIVENQIAEKSEKRSKEGK